MKRIAFSALGLLASTAAHAAASVSMTSPEGVTWNGFNGQAVGQAGTFTVPGIGTFSAFSGPGGEIFNTSVPGVASNPTGSDDNFMAVVGEELLTLATPTTSFTFQWGSVDYGQFPGVDGVDATYNGIITAFDGAVSNAIQGSTILSLMTDVSGLRTAYVTITAETAFNQIIFGSVDVNDHPAPAFEFRIDPVTGGAPEASTWAMMLLGFAGLGYAASQRRRVAAV